MLIELKVQNFAIIENLHLNLKEGLNILSGETGAGKSVLLKSLGLLMGLKSSPEMIRTGAQQAVVEGSFDLMERPDVMHKLEAMGIPCEDHLLIVKRVLLNEKSRVYLNGSLSTLSQLRELITPLLEVGAETAPLIEMTGQFENRDLLNSSYHLDLLDNALGLWDQRENVQKAFFNFSDLEKSLQELSQSQETRERKLEHLKFQRDEIISLDLSPGDDINIEHNIRRLRQIEKIDGHLNLLSQILETGDDSILDRMRLLLQKIQQGQNLELSANFVEKSQTIEACLEMLAEFANTLEKEKHSLQSEFENSAEKIEELERKFSLLRKLQKKYGLSVDAIVGQLLQMETEIADLERSDETIAKLQKQHDASVKELLKLCSDLHGKRLEGAPKLTELINKELKDLNMNGMIFSISVESLSEINMQGSTHVEFRIQGGAKEIPRSLAKIASGGELSRILLSIKRVVGKSRFPRTYLFDEVDTGVSGPTAEKVGRKLKAISKGQQVLCVTHLPQVAAFADGHFCIQKRVRNGKANMEVEELSESARVQELARLISGEKITNSSLEHAKNLLHELR